MDGKTSCRRKRKTIALNPEASYKANNKIIKVIAKKKLKSKRGENERQREKEHQK